MNKKEFLESGLITSTVEEITSFLPARIDREKKSLFQKLLMKLCGVCFDFGKREGTEDWQYPDMGQYPENLSDVTLYIEYSGYRQFITGKYNADGIGWVTSLGNVSGGLKVLAWQKLTVPKKQEDNTDEKHA